MPEKDPTAWAYLMALPEPIKACIAGFGVAFLRVFYDDKEPRMVRRLLESFLCGAIALSIATLAESIGIPTGVSTFAGGAVGLIGADQVREWARRVAASKVERIASDDVQ